MQRNRLDARPINAPIRLRDVQVESLVSDTLRAVLTYCDELCILLLPIERAASLRHRAAIDRVGERHLEEALASCHAQHQLTERAMPRRVVDLVDSAVAQSLEVLLLYASNDGNHDLAWSAMQVVWRFVFNGALSPVDGVAGIETLAPTNELNVVLVAALARWRIANGDAVRAVDLAVLAGCSLDELFVDGTLPCSAARVAAVDARAWLAMRGRM